MALKDSVDQCPLGVCWAAAHEMEASAGLGDVLPSFLEVGDSWTTLKFLSLFLRAQTAPGKSRNGKKKSCFLSLLFIRTKNWEGDEHRRFQF